MLKKANTRKRFHLKQTPDEELEASWREFLEALKKFSREFKAAWKAQNGDAKKMP